MAGGYADFSVSTSNLEMVKRYIANQQYHHRKMNFQDELRTLLRRHEMDWDERYIWDCRVAVELTCADRLTQRSRSGNTGLEGATASRLEEANETRSLPLPVLTSLHRLTRLLPTSV